MNAQMSESVIALHALLEGILDRKLSLLITHCHFNTMILTWSRTILFQTVTFFLLLY